MTVIGGVLLAVIGFLFMFARRFTSEGHLPGDMNIRGKSWSFSFPLVTCIILSVIVTALVNLVFRLLKK